MKLLLTQQQHIAGMGWKMLNLNTLNLFTLPLNGGAAETAQDDLRLPAAVSDEARNDYLRGVSALGNLLFWACENPNYTDHKADLPALGAFLKRRVHGGES